VSHVAIFAQWTGFTMWFLAAWAMVSKTIDIAWRFVSHRRRRRNARRNAGWQPPPPRHKRDPDHDVTRVLPSIQRPKGP